MALVRCRVTGPMSIRDAVTRESIPPGGVVRLDTEKTIMAPLVEAGAVGLLDEAEED